MRRLGGCGARGESGSATVWVAWAGVLLLSLSAAVLAFGAALVARHRATAVADLAALAGAEALLAGSAVPCQAAARVAQAQDARVVACVTDDAGTVEVVSEVPTSPLLEFLAPARARARAGAS